MNKIPATQVTLTRSPIGITKPDFLKTFDGANALVRAETELVILGVDAPERGVPPLVGECDKYDFTVTFADGETYKGRFDLQRGGLDQNKNTLREHIVMHCNFIASNFCEDMQRNGFRFTDVMSDAITSKETAVTFLETYEIEGVIADAM